MANRIRLLMFDLDDTLWPCMPVIFAAEEALYQWLSEQVPVLTDRYSMSEMRAHRIDFAAYHPEISHDMSRVRIEAFRDMARKHALDEDWIETAFNVFLEARQRVTPYPDVIPVLKELAGRYRMAAITNGNADIRRTGLDEWLSFSVSAAEAGAQKPQPEVFEMAMQKAAVSARQCVLVGDDAHRDIYGAASLGISTVWINREGHAWRHPECEADHHIRSLRELPALLEQLEAQVGL